VHRASRESSPTAERLELEDDGDAGDRPSGALQERHGGVNGSTRGEHIVKHEHARSGWQAVGIHLETRRAVLESVGFGENVTRQLAGFAHGDNAHARIDGRRGREQKTARFEARDGVEMADEGLYEGIHHGSKRFTVRKDGCEVSKQDSRLRKVGHRQHSLVEQRLDVGHAASLSPANYQSLEIRVCLTNSSAHYPCQVRFLHLVQSGSSQPQLAIDATGGALLLADVMDEAPRDLQELLERGPEETRRVRDIGTQVLRSGATVTPRAEFSLAPAVLRPPAIIAIGLNYVEHAEELGLNIHADPTVFPLLANSLAADGDTLTWSRALTTQLDFECELGVVIGTRARDVSVDDALHHVFGYTVVNDITARDIQFREQQWSRCKSFDGFTPVGPVVVTRDEIADPQALHLMTTVNGEIMQDSSTRNMIRSVAELIAYLSRHATLLPGTLISTGTPSGAGVSRNPQVLLGDGDTVVVSIEQLGAVTTHCKETA